MKKIISLLLILSAMLGVTSCGKDTVVDYEKEEQEQNQTSIYKYDLDKTFDGVNTAIDFNGIYIDTFADVTLSYYNDELVCVDIENPTVLAYDTTKSEKSGLAVISGDTVDNTIYILKKIKSEMDNDSDIANIEELIQYYQNIVIYGYCPT